MAVAAVPLHRLPATFTASSAPAIQLRSSTMTGAKLQVRVPALNCASTARSSGINGARSLNNLEDDPILKKAIKEPVAFVGGIVAGLLRLDLNEDPLKEWVERTTEAAGVKADEQTDSSDEGPEEITIE
eukprot:TRINITY_DN17890_c0_g1_i1.p1 TRINITY_DN17890_c0_g1~~TRINITY_DN17890_c0_g1_i1.p1  ORF type:complete len:129 (+),score=13.72 TRINITY_DN17890_c0_g1_i1:178-564(+)